MAIVDSDQQLMRNVVFFGRQLNDVLLRVVPTKTSRHDVVMLAIAFERTITGARNQPVVVCGIVHQRYSTLSPPKAAPPEIRGAISREMREAR